MCVCLSGSLWSVGLQHVSDTQGEEWKREERGGADGRGGCGQGAKGKSGEGSDVKGSRGWTIIPRAIKGSELTME